jgi:hypothetical protein
MYPRKAVLHLEVYVPASRESPKHILNICRIKNILIRSTVPYGYHQDPQQAQEQYDGCRTLEVASVVSEDGCKSLCLLKTVLHF